MTVSCKFEFIYYSNIFIANTRICGFQRALLFFLSQHALPSTAVEVLFMLSVAITSQTVVLPGGALLTTIQLGPMTC